MLCLTLIAGFMCNSVDAKAARATGNSSISVNEYTNYPSFSVQTDSNWTATSDSDFITVLNPTGSRGNAMVVVKIDSNPNPSGRSGSIIVTDSSGSARFYVSQARNESAYKAYSNAFECSCDLSTSKTTYVTHHTKRFQLLFYSNNDLKVTDTCNNVTKTINMTKTYDSASKSYKYSGVISLKTNGTPNEISHDITVTVTNSSFTKTTPYKLVQKALIFKNAQITKTFGSGEKEQYTVSLFTNGDAVDVWYEYGDENNRQKTAKKRYYFLMTSTQLEKGGDFSFNTPTIASLNSQKDDAYNKKPVMCIQSYYDSDGSNIKRINIKVNTSSGDKQDEKLGFEIDTITNSHPSDFDHTYLYVSEYYKPLNVTHFTLGSNINVYNDYAHLTVSFNKIDKDWIILEVHSLASQWGWAPEIREVASGSKTSSKTKVTINPGDAWNRYGESTGYVRLYYIMSRDEYDKVKNTLSYSKARNALERTPGVTSTSCTHLFDVTINPATRSTRSSNTRSGMFGGRR